MDPRRKDVQTALLYCLPLFMALAMFILLPVAGTVADSFFRDVTFLPRKFVFLENYVQIFRSEGFWRSLRFTFLFTLVTVPLEVVLGMVFALILNEAIPGRGLLRAAVLIPWAIPAAVSGRAFELVYNYSYGLANWMVLALGVAHEPVNWLGTAPGAFLAVVLADAWKTTPFVALILLAGLSAIPEDIYRQGRVDGVLTLLLDVRMVQDARAVGHRPQAAGGAGRVKPGLGQGGFAGAPVAQQHDVADVLRSGCRHWRLHGTWLYRHPGAGGGMRRCPGHRPPAG